MCLPVVVFLILFNYLPMYGIVIAFMDYYPGHSFFDFSKWIGLENFKLFFESIYAFRLVRNTFLLNIFGLIFGFPIPIIFALLLNEVKNASFKKITQTVSYLPHFISTVVIVGLAMGMLSTNGGIINNIIYALTGDHIEFFLDPKYFRPIYILMDIWVGFGWGSIIYLSSIAGIEPTLYDVAQMDGASRIQRIIYITIPGILPTISILLILSMASLFNLGFQKIILLYNPAIYETADVISSYVYRAGILEAKFSFGTAIGLMNSAISIILLVIFNTAARRLKMATFW